VEKKIWVKQIRGTQQTNPEQRGTLRALGLRGIGSENWIPDSKSVRGMVTAVQHLIKADLLDAPKASVQKKTKNLGYKLG
jgi:ribosomal protein L30